MKKNTKKTAVAEPLQGKTVALTGSTGGIGNALSRAIAEMGASLILLDRNEEKAQAWAETLQREFPGCRITRYTVDLSDIDAVKTTAESLKALPIDILIHNAGAYSIPRCTSNSGYDNVYTINFVSPYYMIREMLPVLEKKQGRVVVVGSIAHNYSKINESDIDFSEVKKASKVYGNAQRFLMFSLYELFLNESKVSLSVTHPGITFTNITAHYPKLIFALIKHPMKVIFMSPEKAALSIVKGFFAPTEYHTWYGPRLFNVWGLPSKKKLTTCSESESKRIAEISETVYRDVKNKIASNKNEVKG